VKGGGEGFEPSIRLTTDNGFRDQFEYGYVQVCTESILEFPHDTHGYVVRWSFDHVGCLESTYRHPDGGKGIG